MRAAESGSLERLRESCLQGPNRFVQECLMNALGVHVHNPAGWVPLCPSHSRQRVKAHVTACAKGQGHQRVLTGGDALFSSHTILPLPLPQPAAQMAMGVHHQLHPRSAVYGAGDGTPTASCCSLLGPTRRTSQGPWSCRGPHWGAWTWPTSDPFKGALRDLPPASQSHVRVHVVHVCTVAHTSSLDL